ncbi:uncharacterized protein E5676_scaffold78209G00670 [Cucumis melo var. makuwa]|uniref:Uncharacterized protein n=1 Tax=Cucumis melo var. makuwa TaxID=1194695 RepID=A0A5D3BBF5_CUCMM|nr:uncharacterized protein E6C27_scaffold30G00420 [Cucumis melo var. makuwa]TYJ96274.1 uncharacterized protein E5676_scaffold78209G00670 [Cucumis melo var. makuwa]
MSSRIFHLQTPLDCLKAFTPILALFLRFLFVCLGAPLMSIISVLIRPNLPIGLRPVCLLGIPFTSTGKSMSEESNNTFEFVEPTPITVSDIDPHPIILPTNQVPWKTYYRRILRKEVESPISQPPTPV